MQIIVTTQSQRFAGCEQVKEVFNARFCAAAGWTEENNYPAAEGESVYVVADDMYVEVGTYCRSGDFGIIENEKARKLDDIAATRYAIEVGGITVSGMTIRTDRESQAMITAAALQATMDAAYTCKWKTANGFIDLTAQMIIGVAQAVRTHVQGCFDHEAELIQAVNDAETVEAVGAVSWNAGT